MIEFTGFTREGELAYRRNLVRGVRAVRSGRGVRATTVRAGKSTRKRTRPVEPPYPPSWLPEVAARKGQRLGRGLRPGEVVIGS